MAPTPVEDIDFPALSDKILELLCALWKLLSDVCLVLWSYISQAFWAMWTYPPFEAFRNELVATLIALKDYVIAHPITTTAIFVLAWIVVPAVLDALQLSVLRCLGFRRQGVLRGSYAANYQSTSYGGSVPRDGTFARLQSQGAKGRSGYRAVGGTGSPSRY